MTSPCRQASATCDSRCSTTSPTATTISISSIYRQSGANWVLVGSTGGATSAETFSLINPTGALYRVFVHGFETDGADAQYTLFHWIVPEPAAGNLTVTAPTTVAAGNTYLVSGSWSGLTAGIKYLGNPHAPSPGRTGAAGVGTNRPYERVHRRAESVTA